MALIVACLVAVRYKSLFLTLALSVAALIQFRPIAVLDAQAAVGVFAGSLRITPMDGVALICIISASVLSVRAGIHSYKFWPFLLLCTLVAMAVIQSIYVHGLPSSIVFWRWWIYAIAFFAWGFAAFQAGLSSFESPISRAGVVAAGLWAYGVAVNGLGSATEYIVEQGIAVSTRPIAAPAALIVLAALLVEVGRQTPITPLRIGKIIAFGAVILLAQHRSVWAAAIVGLTVALVLWMRRARGGALSLPAVALLIAAVGTSISVLVRTTPELADSASTTEGWTGRLGMWAQLLTYRPDFVHAILGEAGGALTSEERRQLYQTGYTSHNAYIETWNRFGLLGLLIVVALLLLIFLRCPQQHRPFVIPFLASIIVFGVAYEWPDWTWLILGLATSSALVKGNGADVKGSSLLNRPRHVH